MLFDLREVGLVHNYHKHYTQKKKYLTPFFPKKNYKLMDTRPCLNKQVSLYPH